MRTLNYQLKVLCEHNRDGSYGNRANRSKTLQQIADELYSLGYIHMNAHTLKKKHVVALVRRWEVLGISPRSQANRVAFIRWWAKKVGRGHLLGSSNAEIGMMSASRKVTQSKAWTITPQQLAQLPDEYVRLAIRLQQAFGLRREEALKFRPSYADHIDYIALKGSWTKGGRPRDIPLTSPDQRPLLDEIHAKVKDGSLIPKENTYTQYHDKLGNSSKRANLKNLHGLRHAYAQRRYLMLTGWPCPFQNGKTKKQMTSVERDLDQIARLQVSHELGHGRIEITSVYLG